MKGESPLRRYLSPYKACERQWGSWFARICRNAWVSEAQRRILEINFVSARWRRIVNSSLAWHSMSAGPSSSCHAYLTTHCAFDWQLFFAFIVGAQGEFSSCHWNSSWQWQTITQQTFCCSSQGLSSRKEDEKKIVEATFCWKLCDKLKSWRFLSRTVSLLPPKGNYHGAIEPSPTSPSSLRPRRFCRLSYLLCKYLDDSCLFPFSTLSL